MMRLFLFICMMVGRAASAMTNSPPTEAVLVMHGLGRSPRSMQPVVSFLETHGYQVYNLDYPTTRLPVEQLVPYVAAQVKAIENERPGSRIHFVTHSLGGIVLRLYLQQRHPRKLGRVVMLCPPNRGSELTDRFEKLSLYQRLYGPAGKELGTGSNSLPNRLGPVTFELGVIAGDRTVNPLYSWMIPGPDDGKVAVSRAQVQGMADFIILPHSHTFMMDFPDVHRQILHFLRTGHFDHTSREH